MRHTLFAAFLCLALADSTAALQQQPTAVPVGVVRAAHKLITRTTDFVGRVEAISRVDARGSPVFWTRCCSKKAT
jgi:membrane fusion protein, multidrug efflux system